METFAFWNISQHIILPFLSLHGFIHNSLSLFQVSFLSLFPDVMSRSINQRGLNDWVGLSHPVLSLPLSPATLSDSCRDEIWFLPWGLCCFVYWDESVLLTLHFSSSCEWSGTALTALWYSFVSRAACTLVFGQMLPLACKLGNWDTPATVHLDLSLPIYLCQSVSSL